MIIGKWYKVTQAVAEGLKHDKVKSYGKCVWIHPEQRLCVLQFDCEIRECFTAQDFGC